MDNTGACVKRPPVLAASSATGQSECKTQKRQASRQWRLQKGHWFVHLVDPKLGSSAAQPIFFWHKSFSLFPRIHGFGFCIHPTCWPPHFLVFPLSISRDLLGCTIQGSSSDFPNLCFPSRLGYRPKGDVVYLLSTLLIF